MNKEQPSSSDAQPIGPKLTRRATITAIAGLYLHSIASCFNKETTEQSEKSKKDHKEPERPQSRLESLVSALNGAKESIDKFNAEGLEFLEGKVDPPVETTMILNWTETLEDKQKDCADILKSDEELSKDLEQTLQDLRECTKKILMIKIEPLPRRKSKPSLL